MLSILVGFFWGYTKERKGNTADHFLQYSDGSTSSEADGSVCPLVGPGQSLLCPPFLGTPSSM